MKYLKLFESDWSGSDELVKEYSFSNFEKAKNFVNKVAEIAEKNNHHPQIIWNYNKVKITLVTHDLGKVTDKDTKMAKEIDEIKNLSN
jgi:4a-hydroxytetrahydrobiopterin dehydratase